jgi:SnoaL-like domain
VISSKSTLAIVLALALAACGGPDNSPASAAGSADAPGAERTAAAERLAALEVRRSLIEDANDIKRLQRAYGYYLDENLWDELADLFAEDGSIEIALDGVYIGRERIREYLYTLGGGHSGLNEGQLNEHMQLMPVVSVAPDGRTAKARWRGLIMAGTLGQDAVWGEGPYENEYVKEDGVWKLLKVHWYQSMLVPYEGGWQVNEDVNGGKYVSATLPPDRQPSEPYDTWPATYLPAFHFPNPVLGAMPRVMPAIRPLSREAAAPSFESVAAEAAVLAQGIQLLEDENAIENLQRIYGFYIEEGFWSEAADLFAADGTIEIGNSGVYEGKDRVLAYLRTSGREFPQDGRLFDQMQLQPIVHVAPDGQTAKARWRLFAQEAEWQQYANWGTGVFENEYVKEDGVWKIDSLHLYRTMYTPYADGWGKTALPQNAMSSSLPPDLAPTDPHQMYPAVFVVPFHYENPVTGTPVYAGSAARHAGEAPANASELAALVGSLEHRMGLLEDTDQIERLNAIYGYYLARNQWDDLAGIFSRNGTIEIAMRGVYVGPESVRRNLNLYGEAGTQFGLLHNHMQYQPVIHVADDGMSAKVRSRAFSIMGQYESYSMWMGGVYENDYIKEDGIWKIEHDQVFNSYFVPYAVGWKDAVPRPPPGITDTNPPDLPPSHPFEMYPKAFVPPFHYPNPVTGREVVWTGE